MRPIDADALVTRLLSLSYIGDGEYFTGRENEREAIIDIINDEMPTVDPVKHGRWVLEMVGAYNDLRRYTCPFCGFSLPLNPTKIPKHCEDCGARLDTDSI